MKCIKSVILLTTLVFGASAFADDPFTGDFSYEYDSTGSPVFSLKTSVAFGDTKTNALAFEVAAGQKTSRANITYGFVLEYDYYFKMTNDFLYQKRQFDFGQNLGKHNEDVYQNAFGVAYRYDIGGSFFKAVELSSYFSYAPSKKSIVKKLKPEDVGGYSYIPVTERGRIAGSKSTHNEIALQVSPLNNSLLTVGVSHDGIKFYNKWEKQVSYSKFGGHVEAEQVLFPWLKARSDYRYKQLTNAYSGGFSAMLPSFENIQLELVGDVSKEDNTALNKRYWLSKLTLKTTLWGGKTNKTYAIASNKQDLREWVNKPVVRIRDVLVLSEINYEKGKEFNVRRTPPNNRSVREMNYIVEQWKVSRRPVSNDVITHAAFYKAKYYVKTGHMYVYYKDYYGDASSDHMTLIYKGHRAVKGILSSSTWKKSENGDDYTCETKHEYRCAFEVKP